MKSIKNLIRTASLLMLTAVIFNSCVKKDYDDLETANVDPDLTVTHSIKQLQSLATGVNGVEITSDAIIAGVLIADDLSGNIYKKMVLQQDSSGIDIQVDISNYNATYKVGRHIYVKCKGLFICNNGGNYELGIAGAPVGRIPAALVSQYLVKGKWGQYLTPKTYALSYNNIPTNTLVKYDNVEFKSPDYGVAWAPSTGSNLTFGDCHSNNTLVVYTSNYSTFALEKSPAGNGSITGVYTVYGGAGELQIRDLNDVKMTGLRCDGSTGIPRLTTIDSLRLMDPDTNIMTLPGDLKIIATVTSNYGTSMLGANSKNAYIEDNKGGIQIRFNAAHTFAIGTKLEINISNMELSNFHGQLQINYSAGSPAGVPIGNAIPQGTGSVTPIVATIPDINANYSLWEGSVVKISNVTITTPGSGIYSGSDTLTDGSGNKIVLFTTASATFAPDSIKTGNVTVTGILTEYAGTKEILVRDPLVDIQ